MMNILPVARFTELVIQETGAELLIYDLSNHKAYCLNQTAAVVYRACDGKTTFEDLEVKHQFTVELIYLTLDELQKINLLEMPLGYISPLAGMNRREVVRRVGLASMIALPIVSGLVVPKAIHAASGCITTGLTQSFNTSGTCTVAACVNCQCTRDYCTANAAPCCSGNPYSSTTYNGATIFCNC